MELLALVLLIPNTANFRHREQADWKFTPIGCGLFFACWCKGLLGGNLELRRVTDGFTPFLYVYFS